MLLYSVSNLNGTQAYKAVRVAQFGMHSGPYHTAEDAQKVHPV